VTVTLGLLAAYAVTGLHLFGHKGPRPTSILVGFISLPLWVFVFYRYRLYKMRFILSRLSELNRLIHAVLTSVLAMGAVSFVFRLPVNRTWTVLSFFFVLLITWVGRQVVRSRFRKMRRRGTIRQRTLIIGTNEEAQAISEQLVARKALGYEVVGFVGPEPIDWISPIPVFDDSLDALAVVKQNDASGVIIASSAVSSVRTNRLVRSLIEAGIHVEISSSLWDVGCERVTIRPLGYNPTIYVEPVSRTGWPLIAKRAFDIVISLGSLVLLAPVILAVAVAVKVDSRGPVLFAQTRVGKDGKSFRVLKFRSMVVNAELMLVDLHHRNEADGPLFKLREDPRVTRVGRFIRRYSLDELPQLINVLLGQMSIVGPRPALFTEMEGWTTELREARLRVRPGLTGIWQVSGRSNLKFEDYVRLDLFYVYNWNLWRDLHIMSRTFSAIIAKDGAY